jgi:hypothetical protein
MNETIIEKVEKFKEGLQAENTRGIADAIINFLNNKMTRDLEAANNPNLRVWGGGWVRGSEIYKLHQQPAVIGRSLKGLVKAGIIERKPCPQRFKHESGKPPVFYRISDRIDPLELMTKQELVAEVYRERELREERTEWFYIAEEIYQRLTGKCDFLPLVITESNRMREERKNTVVLVWFEDSAEGKRETHKIVKSRDEWENTRHKIRDPCEPFSAPRAGRPKGGKENRENRDSEQKTDQYILNPKKKFDRKSSKLFPGKNFGIEEKKN